MKTIKEKAILDFVLQDNVWQCDLPAFLKEIAECSQNGPYKITYKIVAELLKLLAARAIELNDPALNIIMMKLALYEGVHTEQMRKMLRREQNKIQKKHNKV